MVLEPPYAPRNLTGLQMHFDFTIILHCKTWVLSQQGHKPVRFSHYRRHCSMVCIDYQINIDNIDLSF